MPPTGPLEGYTVIDLSRTAPGQEGTAILADMGARVIAVGEPGHAERMGSRRRPSVGRNKRSILIDLRDDEGKAVLWRLLEQADAFVESFRPGVILRLGFGYDAVHERFPQLFYCSLTGYGQTGPNANTPGHDLMYQGMAGMLAVNRQGCPQFPHTIWADRMATMNLAITVLLGLLARERKSVGQFADLSYVDGVLTLPSEEFQSAASVALRSGGPPGSTTGIPVVEGRYPWYQLYQTGDGRTIAVGINEPWFWERLCRYAGKEDWIDQQYADGALREEMFAFFRELFLTRTRDEWLRILVEQMDTQAGPVNSGYEVLEEPQLKARGSYVQVEGPEGPFWQIGIPYRMSETPGGIWRPVSIEGQDTFAIMQELGYSAEQISRMEAAGVIRGG